MFAVMTTPTVVNPAPQRPLRQGIDPAIETFWAHADGPQGDKLALVMVGLPGRGKSYISKKLERYLGFFHGTPTKVFNVGDYKRMLRGVDATETVTDRQSFSESSDDSGAMELRKRAYQNAVNDLKAFLMEDGKTSRVAIYDATNSTKDRRTWLSNEMEGNGTTYIKVIFIECIQNNEELILENIRRAVVTSTGSQDVNDVDMVAEYHQRISHHERIYEPIDQHSEGVPYIKIKDGGKSFESHKIFGYLPSRIVQFLMNVRHTGISTFYLSRHGQSEYNKLGKIGGDSSLTPLGLKYAKLIAEFCEKNIMKNEKGEETKCRLWTSSMIRTIETAQFIPHYQISPTWVQMRPRVWHGLDELYAGICDGMTYDEIKTAFPEEYKERSNNKLEYRYPRGESYLDLISRLSPIVHEMERNKEPLLVIGHQAVLRVLLCYFTGLPREQAPSISFPLHTIVKLTLDTYSCRCEYFPLLPNDESEAPSH